jgi:two-component system, cell cycle sensor histidine kinase and response regulator CckA
MRDVTREVGLEAQFHQSQKMEVIGRLAGGVAHDFNNLLCVIDGYGRFIVNAVPQGHPAADHVRQILAASERAARLTRQLLAFSRKQEMQPAVLDLNESVQESSRMWTRLLGEDVHLVTDTAADLGRVRADPGQVDQVLMNLAVNARDAMPHGGTVTVTTRNVDVGAATEALRPHAAPGRYVRVTVADTGTGMDEATRHRLFEPFFTTKGPGKGTGLGLATVYGIVSQSEGFIDVETELGRGSAFHVHFPRVDDQATLPDAEDPVPATSGQGQGAILVVEDDPYVRGLVCDVLIRGGYEVVACEDAADAVRAAHRLRGRVSLLLTDIVMPGTDGIDTARQVVAIVPSIRVLYVSGYTLDTLHEHGVADGAADLLLKPFTGDALLRRVRAVLGAVPEAAAVGT